MREQYKIQYRSPNAKTNDVIGTISNGQQEIPFSLKKGINNVERKMLVILHGHGANKNFAKYHDEEWDILCPLDIYGTEGLGCWWLGENGDFFVYRLLQELILQLKAENNIQKLFFWGSSMGGYGAILHGIALNADAIYAHMPQVKLRGTDYTDGNNSKYYTPIFNDAPSIYMDLVSYIQQQPIKSGPVFFLSQNVFDYPNYIQQHFFPLLNVLEQKNSAYKVEMNLKKGHVLYEKIYQTVAKFDEFSEEINNWKIQSDIENIYEKEKRELLKFLRRRLELETVLVKNRLFLNFDCLGDDFLYACYLYDGERILSKTTYQKSTKFEFILDQKPTFGLSLKFYLMKSSNKMRVSSTYTI